MARVIATVRFLTDDPYGLWKAGDTADDLGWESPGSGVPQRLLRPHSTGEILSLYDPYGRRLIEREESTT